MRALQRLIKLILLVLIANLTIGCGNGQSEVKDIKDGTTRAEKASGTVAGIADLWFAKMNEAAKKGETVQIHIKDLGEFSDEDRQKLAERVLKSGAVEIGPDGKFEPNKPITRGEYVAWMFGYFNNILSPAPPEKPVYVDVQPEHKYYAIIQRLGADGHLPVDKDKKFRPDDYITREETAFITEYYTKEPLVMKDLQDGSVDYDKTVIEKYFDGDQIDPRYRTAVFMSDFEIGHALGQIRSFCPKRQLTRGQAALWLSWILPVHNYYD
ncbi:S-layer domain protein [Thermincola potens JR]|uniref:S-layer domain protein n=1 Tax=Thermincola potens (strain JR) TaxID=635013 RepID=D5XAJ1_THEPJ|nr:S-layer domain protein [Thermincola potens JR]